MFYKKRRNAVWNLYISLLLGINVKFQVYSMMLRNADEPLENADNRVADLIRIKIIRDKHFIFACAGG